MNNGQQRVRGHELIRTAPDARTWNYGAQGFGRGVPDPCQTEQPVTGSRRSLTETFNPVRLARSGLVGKEK